MPEGRDLDEHLRQLLAAAERTDPADVPLGEPVHTGAGGDV